ncbi:hypothetical protein [Hymenobacter koreensis]|uniref:DUF308 domain-containing protein n=1 Tax=Hymenobacter koreensis TaxID=1084523 RepID=A0ABP8IYQ4_9BACT
MAFQPKNFVRPAVITACLLLVPFVAMQVTSEVNWTLSDFVVMGALIFSTGLAGELLFSQRGNATYRVAAGLAVAAGFLSVWVNLAVGIIGAGPNPANLMLGSTFLIAIIGAVMARFRARDMARAMLAAGAAQFLAPLASLLFWQPDFTPDVTRGLVGNMLFVGLWLASAWLFRQAAEPQASGAGASRVA